MTKVFPEPSVESREAATTKTRCPDRVTLRFLATPADNVVGGEFIAVGSVMEWIDRAGYACAVGWAGTYAVTAYIGNVRHRRPIPAGSLIEVHARIVTTGRTSMHVVVTVSAADAGDGAYRPATSCILVFVAKDVAGRSVPVRSWAPKTRSDLKLARAAAERIPVRSEIGRLMLEETYTSVGSAPETLLRFLVPPSVVNYGGNAHGGTVVRWADEAAYACAVNWLSESSDSHLVSCVYSGGIHFLSPVRIGSLLEARARLVHTTPHSIHISVCVATADPRSPDQMTLTTQCMTVFTLRDASGVSQAVPNWEPATDEDHRLSEHTRRIIELRQSLPPIPVSLALEP